MTQVIKFPDMRPPSRGGPIRELPTPAQFRQTSPAVIAASQGVIAPRVERRRLYIWFGIAVGLHAALFIAIWLTPPLRLKWTPSASDWVRVISLPAPQTAAIMPPAPPAPVKSTKAKPLNLHGKSQPAVEAAAENAK